jgi:geranylgeranyl reductase family protein
MTVSYDAIILGAGPAGAMAAYQLGQAGARVLVLERQKLPRYKPCGGGIPANVFAALPPECSTAIERRVRYARFVLGAEGEVTQGLGGAEVAMVMRDRFDALLLAQARATVRDGEGAAAIEQNASGVSVRGVSGDAYRADCLLGADGATSLAARAAGLRRGHAVGAALEAELAVPNALLERYQDTAVFLFGTVRDGYAWIFPKADHLSVGIGALRNHGSSLRSLLVQAAELLGLPVETLRPRGHALPIYTRREPLQHGRVLLAGDAAGLMDPLSGEGIRYALRSGCLAAEAILKDDLAGYSQRVYDEIGHDLGWGLWLARAFYQFNRFAFRRGVRDPRVVAAMMRILTGQTTYRHLIKSAPGYLLGRRRSEPRMGTDGPR